MYLEAIYEPRNIMMGKWKVTEVHRDRKQGEWDTCQGLPLVAAAVSCQL